MSEMQKVFLVLQACNFFISCSMESNLVADSWLTVWFDILFTFSHLLNLHPCCCSYVQTLDTICVIEIRDSFFFFSRHAQPPLELWLRTLQCEWINILLRTLSIWFLLDHNALRFSLHLAESVLKEIQKTKKCNTVWLFFFLSSSCSEAQI